jgi:hypothetical protein
MKKGFLLTIVLILILLSILSGCGLVPPGLVSSEPVIFTVAVDPEMFSEEATIRFALWDSDQLEIMEKTAGCVISYDAASKTEEVQCPKGVEYEETTPEEYTYSIQEIWEFIHIGSESVTVGERYRLLISGLSNDDCNTTSANVEDVAQSAEIIIGSEDLMWMTTMMACP